jgi:hypothetical protein
MSGRSHLLTPCSKNWAAALQGMVHLILLATVPGKQSNGPGTAVAQEATLANPVLPAMLMASQDGERIYSKLEYRQLGEMPLWSRDRP